MLTCMDLIKLYPGKGLYCCISCHEDANSEPGIYSLFEETLKDGREVSVCCQVRRDLVRLELLEEEP